MGVHVAQANKMAKLKDDLYIQLRKQSHRSSTAGSALASERLLAK